MNLPAGGGMPVAEAATDLERAGLTEHPEPSAAAGPLRLVVVSPPTLLRDCLVGVLDRQTDVQVVAVAAAVAEAQAAVARAHPDLVVLDPGLVDEDGLRLVTRLRADGQGTRVMILSEDRSPRTLQRAFSAGAHSYLCPRCTCDEVMDAVARTAAGETVVGPELVQQLVAAVSADCRAPVELSAREQEVLEHISAGATNAEIARQLGVSVRTVQKHLENLFRQFAVHERAAVVAEAFRQGLLS